MARASLALASEPRLSWLLRTLLLAALCSAIALALSRQAHMTDTAGSAHDSKAAAAAAPAAATLAAALNFTRADPSVTWETFDAGYTPYSADGNTHFALPLDALEWSESSSWLQSLLMRGVKAQGTAAACSGQGAAVSGTCRCNNGYLTSTCSLLYDFEASFGTPEQVNVKWTYDATKIYVQIRTIYSNRWAGLMLNPDAGTGNSMMNADCWMVRVDDSDGSIRAEDRYSTGRTLPPLDANGVLLSDRSGYQSNTGTVFTQVSFSRLLNSNDAAGKDVTFASSFGPMRIAWATGPEDTKQHGATATDRGTGTIEWIQPKGAPSVPLALTLVTAGDNTLLVQWTIPQYAGSGSTINSYVCTRETTPGSGVFVQFSTGVPTRVANSNPAAYQASITGLLQGSFYVVRVVAYNTRDLFSVAAQANMKTKGVAQHPPSQPLPPTKTASSSTSAAVTLSLSWVAPAENGASITAYYLRYKLASDATWTAYPGGEIGATSATVSSGLVAASSYQVQVAAKNVIGLGLYSNVTTLDTDPYPPCVNDCGAAVAAGGVAHGVCFRGNCQCDSEYLGADCATRADFSYCPGDSDVPFCVHWTHVGDLNSPTTAMLLAQVDVASTGWVGISVGADPSGGMTNSDNFVATVVDDGTGGQSVAMTDRFAAAPGKPVLDGQQDLLDVTGWESSTPNADPTQAPVVFTRVNFRRALDTGETTQDRPIVPGANQVSWAYGPPPSSPADELDLGQHDPGARGRGVVDFLQPTGPPTAPGTPDFTTATISSADIEWNAPTYAGSGGHVVSYRVERETAPGSGVYSSYPGPSAPIDPLASPLRFGYTFTGLLDDKTYAVRVYASNDRAGEGVASPLGSVTTLSAAQKPPGVMLAPSFVSASSSAAAVALTVAWVAPKTNNAPITGYVVQFQLVGAAVGDWTAVPTPFPAGALSGSFGGMVASSSYNVQIAATSVAGQGVWSPSRVVQTADYPACLNGCSAHGACFRGVCRCVAGYLGLDCSVRADFHHCENGGAGEYCLHWTYDNTYAYFQMDVATTGWVGLCLGADPSNGMMNADTFIGTVVADGTGGQSLNVADYFSPSTQRPDLDAHQDLMDTMGYEVAPTAGGTPGPLGRTLVWFKRLLDTGDVGQDKPVVSGPVQLSWGYGPLPANAAAELALKRHDPLARGRMVLELLQPKGPPSAPASLVLAQASSSSLTIEWLASVYPGSGAINAYTLQVEDAPGSGVFVTAYTGMPDAVRTVPATTYSATITGLALGSVYRVRAAAMNDYDPSLSSWSTPLSARTLDANQHPPSAPAPPVFVSATPDTLTVGWTAPGLNGLAVTGYVLRYALGSGSWTTLPTVFTPSTTQATITALQAGSIYAVQVAARSIGGLSAWSVSGSMTTPAQTACPNSCSGRGACVGTTCHCLSTFLGNDCSRSTPTGFTRCTPTNKMCMHWTHDSQYIYFQFEHTTPLTSWAGWIIGHQPSGGMDAGDCWSMIPVAAASSDMTSNAVLLEDRWSAESTYIPSLDAVQNLQDHASYVRASDSALLINFRRALVTTDSQFDRPFVQGDMTVSWALGSGLNFQEHTHGPDEQGKMFVNFLQAFTVGPPALPRFAAPILTAASLSFLTLQFLAPLTNGSSPIVKYEVYLCSNDSSTITTLQSAAFLAMDPSAQLDVVEAASVQINTVSSAGALATTFSPLTAETCYPVTLRAINSDGAGGFARAEVVCTVSASDIVPPAPPATVVSLEAVQSGPASAANGWVAPLLSSLPTEIRASWYALHSLLLSAGAGNNISTTPLVGYRLEVQLLPSINSTLSNLTDDRWVDVYAGYVPAANVTGLDSKSLYALRLAVDNVVGRGGWSLPVLVATSAFASCPGDCASAQGQGACVQGLCECNSGWLGSGCELPAVRNVLSNSPFFALTSAVSVQPTDTSALSRRRRRLLSAGGGTMYATVEADAATGWAGLILSPAADDGMRSGDVWMFHYEAASGTDPGGMKAVDWWSSSQVKPTGARDATQDLQSVRGRILPANRVLIHFTRALQTGDAGDKDIVDELTWLAWAVGPTEVAGTGVDYAQHSLSQRGKVLVNLFTGQVEVPTLSLSYLWPIPIFIAIFCVMAVTARNIDAVRRSGFVKVMLHQPLLRTLNKYLNPMSYCAVQIAEKKGFRQHWADVWTLDVRRTVLELSCGEFVLMVLYACAIASCTVWAQNTFKTGGRVIWLFWGDLTAIHLALAVLPVARTSFFLYTCGISFERAVKWHRWVSRVAVALCCVHFAENAANFETARLFASTTTAHGYGNVFGFIAFISMLCMTIAAFEPIRRRAFNLFYYAHLALIVPVYLFACLHSLTATYLIVPALALYSLDRILRRWRSTRATEIIGLEVIDVDVPPPVDGEPEKPSTCIVHIQMKQEKFTFEPGQYIFLNIPQISALAWHPFSISSSNQVEGLFSVHVLSRRTGLDALRDMSKQLQFGQGVGIRTAPGAVGMGQCPSSGNTKDNPALVSDDAPPADAAKVAPVLASADADLVENPMVAHQRVSMQAEEQSGASPSHRSSTVGADGHRRGSNLGTAWETIELNPFSWTSDLLIRSMRYFARCSSYVGTGNNYRAEDFPPPPMSVKVDGPYGCINMRMKQDYHTLVMIAGGIGITPFFSILYDLLASVNDPACPIEVVHLVWVCSDANVFHLIHPALWQRIKLSPKFRLHFYATRNARKSMNKGRFSITLGRPIWRSLFHSFAFNSKDSLEFQRQQRLGALPPVDAADASGVQIEMQNVDGSVSNDSIASPSHASQPSAASPSHASEPSAESAPAPLPGAPPAARSSTSHFGVAAFACGPAGLVSDVEEQCSFHSVEFHKEVFLL